VSHSRRDVVAGLCTSLFVGGERDAFGFELTLESDQGFVLCSLTTSDPSLIRSLEFRQFDFPPTFNVVRDIKIETPIPSIAKLGRYYLEGSYSIFANVGKALYRKPADERGTFEIVNGAVNYIGDWFVDKQHVRFTVHLETIARFRRVYPWLEKYQLFVSIPGTESFALSWKQVPELRR
jgi:hypothetical protein